MAKHLGKRGELWSVSVNGTNARREGRMGVSTMKDRNLVPLLIQTADDMLTDEACSAQDKHVHSDLKASEQRKPNSQETSDTHGPCLQAIRRSPGVGPASLSAWQVRADGTIAARGLLLVMMLKTADCRSLPP